MWLPAMNHKLDLEETGVFLFVAPRSVGRNTVKHKEESVSL